jgi:hypothetical protein
VVVLNEKPMPRPVMARICLATSVAPGIDRVGRAQLQREIEARAIDVDGDDGALLRQDAPP